MPRAAGPNTRPAIYEDLRWLGIAWQQDRAPAERVFRRLSSQAVHKLEAMGLLYPSFESRSEIAALVAERDRQGHWPRDPDGVPLYPGRAAKCRRPSASGAAGRASPMRFGSPWTRPSRRPAS